MGVSKLMRVAADFAREGTKRDDIDFETTFAKENIGNIFLNKY